MKKTWDFACEAQIWHYRHLNANKNQGETPTCATLCQLAHARSQALLRKSCGVSYHQGLESELSPSVPGAAQGLRAGVPEPLGEGGETEEGKPWDLRGERDRGIYWVGVFIGPS